MLIGKIKPQDETIKFIKVKNKELWISFTFFDKHLSQD